MKLTDSPTFINDLSRPIRVDGKPQFDNIQTNIFVKGIENDFGDSGVIPGPMNKK